MSDDYLQHRRAKVATAWDLDDEIVVVGSGEPVPIPGGQDQTYPFRAHTEYLWLADRELPGCVLAFDPQDGPEGAWTDFVPEVTEAERVWEGGREPEGTPLSRLPEWIEARRGRRAALLGAPVQALSQRLTPDTDLSQRLKDVLLHVRRPKDEVEIERMRRAVAATAAGFEAARRAIGPGVAERQIQIELEAAFFKAGADRCGYDTIVGVGQDAAVFHFAPGDRQARPGELVLIDAGAECDHYTADVTRTYPVDEGFTPEQRDLYEIVLAAEVAAIERCRPGTEYRDIHMAAALDLARGLVDFGLLRGNPEDLVERDAHALFFPHGIGHLVGLGVRDASGYLAGRTRSDRPGLEYLRLDLPLEAGYIVTIEPGLYFIPALLESEERRREHADDVDWERVDQLLGFGGIRIEDDVLVTEDGPEVLTAAIPKDL